MKNSDTSLKPSSTKLMKLSTLRANPTNPRIIKDEKFQKLVKSIEEFPEMLEARPIVVNPEMVVIGGNMRFKACKAAGLKEAPVYMATWGETKDREFIIKDNVSSGENDFDILANEWDAEELNEWGLDVWTGEPEETEGLTDPDDVPEVPEEAKTKLGDLYILGDHRLFCGDSTKAEDVEKLMNGEKAEIVFTDPPYGISVVKNGGIGSGGKYAKSGKYREIIGDDARFDISIIRRNFNCNLFLWGANYYCHDLEETNSWVIWQKIESSLTFSDGEMAWTDLKTPLRIYKHIWAGSMRSGNHKDELKTRVHPTQKPVTLFVEIFNDLMPTKKNIVDLFLGSGSTLIAAEKTNRKCYGMELDPKYCDVIVKRWEDFTGKKATKENL
jgi:DNA modification methylase